MTRAQLVQHKKAEEELKLLETNEATMAFAGLQEAQELEVLAESALGSGEQAETEAEKKKKKDAERK